MCQFAMYSHLSHRNPLYFLCVTNALLLSVKTDQTPGVTFLNFLVSIHESMAETFLLSHNENCLYPVNFCCQ